MVGKAQTYIDESASATVWWLPKANKRRIEIREKNVAVWCLESRFCRCNSYFSLADHLTLFTFQANNFLLVLFFFSVWVHSCPSVWIWYRILLQTALFLPFEIRRFSASFFSLCDVAVFALSAFLCQQRTIHNPFSNSSGPFSIHFKHFFFLLWVASHRWVNEVLSWTACTYAVRLIIFVLKIYDEKQIIMKILSSLKRTYRN